jgi:hypothetical protein
MMRFVLVACALVVFAVGTTACVDPLNPDVDRPPDVLVVDGLVANGPGPHAVRLSFAGAFEQSLDGAQLGVPGADVTIEDDAGTTVQLVQPNPDLDPALYETREGELIGEVGRTYVLRITLPDGRSFTSRPEPMPQGADIDSLYTEATTDGTGSLRTIVVFDDPPEPGNAYRWSMDGTYGFARRVRGFCGQGVIDVCFARDQATTYGTKVEEDRLFNGSTVTYEIRRFQNKGGRLLIPYSLRVEQRSLSPGAYAFWNTVRTQLENNGSTFSNPPARIEGNVRNDDDPRDVALGYFGASYVSSATHCINPSEYESYQRTLECDGTGDCQPPCVRSCRDLVDQSTTFEPDDRKEICGRYENVDGLPLLPGIPIPPR